jgi:hypothetical protein
VNNRISERTIENCKKYKSERTSGKIRVAGISAYVW